MSKGGYLGGSTIVGRRGWSSFDPASGGKMVTKQKVKKRKVNANTSSLQTKQKNLSPAQPTKKQAHKQRPPNFDRLRLAYLEAIVDAALLARPAPKAPKRARAELVAATLSAGGPVEWAKTQPEYAAALEKKQKKLARKAQPDNEGGKVFVAEARLRPHVSVPESRRREPADQITRKAIENLCRERARLSLAVASAEADLRRYKAAIRQIDRTLVGATSPRR